MILDVAAWIIKYWDGKCCYQSIFLDGKEVVRGNNRQDALLRINAIRDRDVMSKSVLDLGCNHGHTAMMIAERGAIKVVGLDMRADLIMYAQQVSRLLGLPCDFIQHDLSMPYRNGVFDTILCLAVYDGISPAKLLETIDWASPSTVYFEGHRKGGLSEQDYRAEYHPFLAHFAQAEAIYSAPMRYMYRCTTKGYPKGPLR